MADQRRSWLVSLIAAELTTRTSYQMGKSPLLPVFATLLGAGAEVLGLIVAVSTVTGLLASPIAGALSDRYGRRRFLLAGTVLFALPSVAYPFVHYPQELIALRLVHGGATAIWGPVVAALVADLFPRTRAESMGWYRSARSASYFLGPLLGGLVLLRVDARAAWLAVGALAMTAALGVVLGLGEAAVVPPLNALATQVVEGRSYGSRLGLLEATDNVGKAGGPILAGLLIGRLHFAGCFIIIAGLLLAAPATFSIGARPGAPAAREGLLPARGAEPRRR